MARNEKPNRRTGLTPAQQRAYDETVKGSMKREFTDADRDRDWEGTEAVFDTAVQFADNPEDRD